MGHKFNNVVLEPIITEKSTGLSAHNKYTFKVAKDATKSKIKDAIAKIFPNRKILSVHTQKLKGHTRRTKKGFKFPVDGKKAIVTIEGDRIEYFPESA